jgi:hypothetical protein
VFAALVFDASISVLVDTGDTSTIAVDTIGFGLGAGTPASGWTSVDTSARGLGDISRAAITMTAPVTHMAVTSIAPAPN